MLEEEEKRESAQVVKFESDFTRALTPSTRSRHRYPNTMIRAQRTV